MTPTVSRLFGLFKRSESYRFGLALSLFINLCAKALGFFTTILTALLFGSSTQTDLFFFAIASTGIIVSFLINLDGTVVIPRSMKLRADGDVAASNNLLSFTFTAYFLISGVIAAGIIICPSGWMRIVSRFDSGTFADHLDLIRLTGPWLVISTLNFFLIDVITSFKRFSLPVVAGLLGSIANVTFILLTHQTLGIRSVVAGSLAGGICQFIILLYSAWRLAGSGLRIPRFPITGPMFKYMLFSQGAYVCSLFASFIPMYLLSGQAQGTVSALGYGQRIIDLISLLLIAQFSNVLAIKLNELHISKAVDELASSFVAIGKTALFFVTPVAVITSVVSFEVLLVLFTRGEFSSAQALDAARFTRVLVFTIPLLLLNTMVARLVMASNSIDRSFGFQAASGIMIGLFCAAGIHFAGPYGYPYGMIIAYLLNLVTVGYLLRKWVAGFTGLYPLLRFGLLVILINGAIIPVDLAVKKGIGPMHPVAIMAIIATLHIIIYGLISYLTRLFPPFNDAIRFYKQCIFNKRRSQAG